MDVEDALALVLAGGDCDISLSQFSADESLLSSSKEEEVESDHAASENKEGSSDDDKDVSTCWRMEVTMTMLVELLIVILWKTLMNF